MDVTVLNLGCGMAADPADGVLNVDAWPYPNVQMVWDLDDIPWPWGDELFAEVRAVQVFEHVHDAVGFMREAHRVLAPGGLLHIVTPYYGSENAFTDPTHVRFCTLHSWDYWIDGRPLARQFPGYADGRLFDAESIVLVEVVGGPDIDVRLRRLP